MKVYTKRNIGFEKGIITFTDSRILSILQQGLKQRINLCESWKESATEEKKAEIDKEIAEYRKYLEELENEIDLDELEKKLLC
ncbi:hypothetical protein [Clostridiisalibacter paucivorans]|uniref:hypothetical protein n=1 Tax=Clostridiisalibacter paucivorans TaxID=408753 RepID=UPI00047E63C7|nr:hypothetical protein [Clostridiisalibacter paucivorans]